MRSSGDTDVVSSPVTSDYEQIAYDVADGVATYDLRQAHKFLAIAVIFVSITAITGFSATASTAEQLVSGYLSEDRQRHAGPLRVDPDSGPTPH